MLSRMSLVTDGVITTPFLIANTHAPPPSATLPRVFRKMAAS